MRHSRFFKGIREKRVLDRYEHFTYDPKVRTAQGENVLKKEKMVVLTEKMVYNE